MKGIFLIFFWCFSVLVSCNYFDTSTSSSIQVKKTELFDSLQNVFNVRYSSLPNTMQKDEYKLKFLDTVRTLVFDSLKYIVRNSRLYLDKIKNEELRNVRAFYAEFHDRKGNIFYTEFDYALNDDSSLQKNAAYRFLRDKKEGFGADYDLFVLGGIDWDGLHEDKFRMRVVPFQANFNFDSAKIANQEIKKLKNDRQRSTQ